MCIVCREKGRRWVWSLELASRVVLGTKRGEGERENDGFNVRGYGEAMGSSVLS